MDEQELKHNITDVFNTVSDGYDNASLRFFQKAAEQLPSFFHFQGNEHVLDNATGTGRAALVLAEHLPNGQVTAVDLSMNMLAKAKQKADAFALKNVAFQLMDIESLEFNDQHFDHANCSFCLFFLPDMLNVLTHIKSKVKTGGKIVSCGFAENSFQPQRQMFMDRIQTYGVEVQEGGFNRLDSEEKNRELYSQAGLKNIQVHRVSVGYPLSNAEQWWEIIWYAGYRGYVSQLSETDLPTFRQQHLDEIQALTSDQGLDLTVDVFFVVGEV